MILTPFTSRITSFKLKNDVKIDGFDDVVVKITDNAFIIEAAMNVDGLVCDVEIEIFDIGEVELTLPKTK